MEQGQQGLAAATTQVVNASNTRPRDTSPPVAPPPPRNEQPFLPGGRPSGHRQGLTSTLQPRAAMAAQTGRASAPPPERVGVVSIAAGASPLPPPAPTTAATACGPSLAAPLRLVTQQPPPRWPKQPGGGARAPCFERTTRGRHVAHTPSLLEGGEGAGDVLCRSGEQLLADDGESGRREPPRNGLLAEVNDVGLKTKYRNGILHVWRAAKCAISAATATASLAGAAAATSAAAAAPHTLCQP